MAKLAAPTPATQTQVPIAPYSIGPIAKAPAALWWLAAAAVLDVSLAVAVAEAGRLERAASAA